MRKRAGWRVEQLEAREVPSTSPGFFAAGTDAGGPSIATFYNPDGTARFSVQPFGPAFAGGVRVAVGDVDGDGTPDLITAAGPGTTPSVKTYSGVDGTELGGFTAFEDSFTGGVNVAAGDLNQDGVDEIILSPDAGGGPRVRIVSGADGAEVLADFMGLEDPGFRGGVRVAVGDVNQDQVPDLLVGAGAGGGSRVALYSGVGLLADPSNPTRLVNDFLVFDSSLRDGVNLAVGDVNGDGYVDLVFGAGAGGSPRVVVADGKAFLAAGGMGDSYLLNTFAFDQTSRTGARIAVGDLDGDGIAEVLVGPGPGLGGVVRRYSLNGTAESTDLVSPFDGSRNGLFVAVQSQPTGRKNDPAVNTPPQISDTSDPTAVAAGTVIGPIGFTVSDLETASTKLVVTASSSNPAVVPNSGIILGGSRTNRTVTLTPVAGAAGTATITLTVTDAGGQAATDSFTVTFTTPDSPPPPPPVNTAPQISNVSNQTVPQGGNTGAITFTVSDGETAPPGLVVTATSSNPTLVPQSAITLTGAGQDRTVTVAPAAGQSGTATITLTVTDAGGLTAADTFTVTVTPPPPPPPPPPVNTAPHISDVSNQTVPQGGNTGAITFTVSDGETAPPGLVVTATSSNPTLVPQSAITLTGAGQDRTVTVAPAAGQSGTATITLTVTDAGGLTAADTFTVTVTSPPPPPGNTAPHISDVGDQTVPQGGSTGTLPFTITDAETAPSGLVVTATSSNPTLVPQSGITLTGTGQDRTVTVTPLASQSGTATITLTVTDAGGLTVTDTFVITVPPASPPPPGNTAPQISNVGDQTVPMGGYTGAVPFTVSDAESPATGLTVSASSSNPSLVPQSAIALTGVGRDRAVSVTPAAGQAGSATITLTVTDAGGLTATDTFVVTVPPVSPPPPVTPSDPRALLTSADLATLRQQASANTAQWQAFKARLDRNLTTVLNNGSYQGSQLSWIADYALGYQVLKGTDPVTAARYADKAIALMKTGMRDFQATGYEARQFLARGDGVTKTYTLPNPDLIPSTVRVYVSSITTLPVVRGNAKPSYTTADIASFYYKYLKVSNTPDGLADYSEGVDWRRNGDLRNDLIDWSPAGLEPASGATYYVTAATSLGGVASAFTLSGAAITLATPPGPTRPSGSSTSTAPRRPTARRWPTNRRAVGTAGSTRSTGTPRTHPGSSGSTSPSGTTGSTTTWGSARRSRPSRRPCWSGGPTTSATSDT